MREKNTSNSIISDCHNITIPIIYSQDENNCKPLEKNKENFLSEIKSLNEKKLKNQDLMSDNSDDNTYEKRNKNSSFIEGENISICMQRRFTKSSKNNLYILLSFSFDVFV